MSSSIYKAPSEVARLQRLALIAGVVGLVLLGGGALVGPVQFWRSYLVGYLFWLGLPVGALALLMLQHLTGGGWGLVIRRVLEAATRTLPVMFVLFLPLLLGVRLRRREEFPPRRTACKAVLRGTAAHAPHHFRRLSPPLPEGFRFLGFPTQF